MLGQPATELAQQPTVVVCPLSSFPIAERALPSAYDAAQLLGARLHLFSAVEDAHMIEARRGYLDDVARRTRGAGTEPPATEVVVDPHAPHALADIAASPAALTVMATSSMPLMHTGYVGSAAEFAARAAHHPVLLYGPHATTRLGDVERVVVPVDGSPLAEHAIPDASAWAERLGVRLWVVTSISRSEARQAGYDADTEANYVRRMAEPYGAAWEVLHGEDPAKTVAQWAGNSLIAMTTRGRSGLSRLSIGSVTAGVTRWAAGPVLVNNGHAGIRP